MRYILTIIIVTCYKEPITLTQLLRATMVASVKVRVFSSFFVCWFFCVFWYQPHITNSCQTRPPQRTQSGDSSTRFLTVWLYNSLPTGTKDCNRAFTVQALPGVPPGRVGVDYTVFSDFFTLLCTQKKRLCYYKRFSNRVFIIFPMPGKGCCYSSVSSDCASPNRIRI